MARYPDFTELNDPIITGSVMLTSRKRHRDKFVAIPGCHFHDSANYSWVGGGLALWMQKTDHCSCPEAVMKYPSLLPGLIPRHFGNDHGYSAPVCDATEYETGTQKAAQDQEVR